MFARESSSIELPEEPRAWETQLASVPEAPAVFLIHVREGLPYLGRTTRLGRRLRRLLEERSRPARWLNLRAIARRIEYWPVASRLEAALVQYELARRYYPEDYRVRLRLHLPPYLKIVLTNPFPRSQITSRLSRAPALYYGPFRSRAAADQFQSQLLDLFQIRRCEEDLAPSPAHPGCIYGEMNMCLRPCQAAVTREEYAAEVERLLAFLRTQGRSLRDVLASARDRLSEELNFEEAARFHKRLEKIDQVLRWRDSLAGDLDRLSGVAVTPSTAADAAELWFLVRGWWQAPRRFLCRPSGASISMDQRLRELVAGLQPVTATLAERQEHLAVLARWFYSSQRDGEWFGFETPAEIPYRRLVRAISRVVSRAGPETSPEGDVTSSGGIP